MSADTTQRPPPAGPGFRAALASEWTKLTTLRSTRVTLLLGTVLGIGVTALLGWVVLLSWDDWPADERAAFDPADSALIGTVLTGTLFAVLGVTAVSSEYSSRMAMLTFTATPRRTRVLLAKAVVVSIVTAVATLVAVAGMVLVTRLLFAGEPVPQAHVGRIVRVVLGLAAEAPLFPVIGVALTFVLRSAAGSVTALLALIFGPIVLTPLLPQWFQDQGQRYLPGAAADSLALPPLPDAPVPLSHGIAALVVVGWLALFLGLAAVVLERRDA